MAWRTPSFRASELVFVLACSAVVCVVATVQMFVVLDLDESVVPLPSYLLPIAVGGGFGTLVVVVRRLQEGLQRRNERISALLQEVEELAAARGEMVNEAHHALQQAERAAAAGFIAGQVAHDLNNLLTIMLGGVSILSEDGADPQTVESMHIAGDRASRLTQRLLKLVRKRDSAGPELVAVDPLMTELEPLLQRMLPDRQSLQTELAADRPAWVDPGAFEMCVLNLVANARDASSESGTIELRSRIDGDMVSVEVIDEGQGMNADELRQAMTPLHTTKGGDGTGLGLSIVQDVMEQCGGELQLLSEVGRGTTARLRMRAEPQ